MPGVHPLGALITDRMRVNEWSLDDVVARAVARGEKLGRSNLQRIQATPPASLKRDVIFALAAGLGVTPLSVANAALQSMGINPLATEVTDSLATIEIDPTLSDRDRRQLRTLIIDMRSDEGVGALDRETPRPTFADRDMHWGHRRDQSEEPPAAGELPREG